jgi:hypothetical protein
MHPLHHRSRRALCILAFWGLGVLPLGLVLTWCMWRHRPGRVAEEAESLGQQLGLTVTIQAVHDLRPGATRYEGVRLIHPETGRSVFFASSLETGWEPATDSTKRPVEALTITLSGGEMGVESLDELERLIQRVMEGRAGCHDPQVRLRAHELQLHAGQRVQNFAEVQALVDSVADGVQTVVYFHLADVVMPAPAKIRFLRNRGTTPPSAGFEFSSGDTPLPCELLLPGLPQLARLGRQCKFQGSIAGDQFSGPWQGRVAGQFSDVDCESLLADYPPQRLSGAGQLLVDARFREGRLEMASGDLRAGPGTISQSLLDAAAHCFGLSRGPKPQLDPAPYEQLALAFTFSEQGINVQGRCPVSGPPAAILVDRSTRMLGEPAAKSIPTIALVQLLVPPGEAQVSVSRSCEQILRWLPIPEAVDGGRWPADGGEPTVGSRPPAAVSRQ